MLGLFAKNLDLDQYHSKHLHLDQQILTHQTSQMTTRQMMTDSQNGSLPTSMTTKGNVFECSVDQINNDIALLTHPDHLPLAIPLTFLPSGVKEGDLMIFSFNLASHQKQEEIKNQVSSLLQKQTQDDDGNDFSI